MNTQNHRLLLLARGGMELSWRYAWVLFTALLEIQLTFPLPGAACAMFLGALITRMSMAGNFRNYQKILLQLTGFVLVSLLILYWIQYAGSPFWDLNWIRHLFSGAKSHYQWFILLVLVSFLWLFWQGGRLLVKGSQQYQTVCIHFDKGMGLFIGLLIVSALVDLRTELNLQNQGFHFVIFAFFTFSLASIILSRYNTSAHKSFISGYHGVGVVLSALTMAGIFATGTTLLAYPYLFHQADTMLGFIKKSAAPFKPLLMKILLFLFRPNQLKIQTDIHDKKLPSIEEIGAPVLEGWQAVFIKILGVGLVALTGLAILTVLVFLVYKLVFWMSKRDRNAAEQMRLGKGIGRFLKACQAFLLRIRKKILELAKGLDSAAMIYYRLLRWGRYSGVIPMPSNTPSQCGRRLMESFPGLKSEIHLIVEGFNREVYGRTVTDRQTLVQLALAYRRMRRLKHWPSRIKTWFYQ